MERLYTAKEIADQTGMAESYIRAACKRSREYHQLPHVVVGESRRPHRLISMSDFEKWIDEEKEISRS